MDSILKRIEEKLDSFPSTHESEENQASLLYNVRSPPPSHYLPHGKVYLAFRYITSPFPHDTPAHKTGYKQNKQKTIALSWREGMEVTGKRGTVRSRHTRTPKEHNNKKKYRQIESTAGLCIIGISNKSEARKGSVVTETTTDNDKGSVVLPATPR